MILNNNKVAKKMKKEGFSTEQITRITGLNDEEIGKL